MKKLFYILCAASLLAGCGRETPEVPPGNGNAPASIELAFGSFRTRVVDEDNLESEQTINNITVLLTEPSSDVISHKFVSAGFTTVDDYKLVTIPVELSTLGYRDIYVITNYGNASFNAINTIGELSSMKTPTASKNSPLTPANGFCMFGRTLNFNFSNTTNTPAKVYALRTCAKYRITLKFPQDPNMSANNSYLITNAASYTYIPDNSGGAIPAGDYFNYSRNTALEPDGSGAFSSIAYTYEAPQAPVMYLYTNMNNARQEFSAALPVPERNYFYDIEVLVYDIATRGQADGSPEYRLETKITAYGPDGSPSQPRPSRPY